MKISDLSFAQICPTIQYSFQWIAPAKPSISVDILIVRFTGQYRDGSAGNADARLMYGIIKAGICVWEPDAVVVDLTELVYEWGDYIEYAFGAPDELPIAIVVGAKCRRALSTLTYGLNTQQDIVDNHFYFDSLEKAINSLRNK